MTYQNKSMLAYEASYKKRKIFVLRSFSNFELRRQPTEKIQLFSIGFDRQISFTFFSNLITPCFLLAKGANQLFRDEYLHVFIKST